MTDEHTTPAGDTPGGTEAPETLADPESAVNTDLTSAVDAEDFDEDRLGVDPLEEGVDPPEGWTAADRQGVTAREQAVGETLDQRLAAERPDTGETAGTSDTSAPAGRDPDAEASADDVPTADENIENRDDPGEEYR